MDSLKYFTDKVHTTDLPKKKMADHISFWATKLFYIGFYIVTPLIFLGFSKFIFGFFFFNFVMGIVMSVVFQLAHVVEGVEYANAQETGILAIDEDWAIFQMKTTFDFCPDNKLSHVHYPAIRKIVVELANKYDIQHNEFPSFWIALKSHFKMMHALGRPNHLLVA